MRCWRLTPAAVAAAAFSGEESRRNGGRWNSPGVAAVYCARHLATAILELLANADGEDLREPLVASEAEVPDELLRRVADGELPACWHEEPPPAACRAFGDRELGTGPHVGLVLPSSLIPEERNVALAPRHPGMERVRLLRRVPLRLDPRLARGR